MDPDKKSRNERVEGEEQRNTDNDKEDSSNWPKIAAPTFFLQFLLELSNLCDINRLERPLHQTKARPLLPEPLVVS